MRAQPRDRRLIRTALTSVRFAAANSLYLHQAIKSTGVAAGSGGVPLRRVLIFRAYTYTIRPILCLY